MLLCRPNVSPASLMKMLKVGTGTISVVLPDDIAENMFNTQRFLLFQEGDMNTFLRLERDNKYRLTFFYTTSGLGTHAASLPLGPFASVKGAIAKLQWSPDSISIELQGGGKTMRNNGKKSNKLVFPNGPEGVLEIGDENAEVGMFKLYADDKLVAKSSAIDAWRHMLEGCKILLSGHSEQGYMFDVIQRNFFIVMLVTGFEAYCKERFLEAEKEGRFVDNDALASAFFSTGERDGGEPQLLKDEAKADGISFAEKLVKTRRIDFQNWDYCKKAYNKGYGIKFSELGLASDCLAHIQKFIKYRHRIVHVSALEAMLEVGGTEPLFCTKPGLCESAMERFDEFIQLLHAKTISRP